MTRSDAPDGTGTSAQIPPNRSLVEKEQSRVPIPNPEVTVKPFDVWMCPGSFVVSVGDQRQFRVSAFVKDVLGLIDGKRSAGEIADKLRTEFGSNLSAESVNRIVDEYFIPLGFIAGRNAVATGERSFLHLRVSLLSQDELRPVTNSLRFLFNKYMFGALISFSIVVTICTWLAGEVEVARVGEVGGLQLLAVYCIVLVTALVHELGHSTACAYCGARHGNIGVGLYMFFPVLFADVSDIWGLPRKKRVVVDAGGIYFQILCVPVLCGLYMVTRSTIVLAAIYATFITIATALNPFLRFDGYWLVSDLFGVPNLRKRSNEMISLFRKRASDLRSLRTRMKDFLEQGCGPAVIVYGVLSAVFFILLFVQVAFLFESYIERSIAIWSEFLKNSAGDSIIRNLSALFDMFNAMLPMLLLIVPLLVWAIRACMLFVRQIRMNHARPKTAG